MYSDTAHPSDTPMSWWMTVSCLSDNISRLAMVLPISCPVDEASRVPSCCTGPGEIWAGNTSCRKNLVRPNFPENTHGRIWWLRGVLGDKELPGSSLVFTCQWTSYLFSLCSGVSCRQCCVTLKVSSGMRTVWIQTMPPSPSAIGSEWVTCQWVICLE